MPNSMVAIHLDKRPLYRRAMVHARGPTSCGNTFDSKGHNVLVQQPIPLHKFGLFIEKGAPGVFVSYNKYIESHETWGWGAGVLLLLLL